nr:hypothetical protein [uncultured Tyzzerella sp.]
MLNKIEVLLLAELDNKKKYTPINSVSIDSFDTAKCMSINTIYKKICNLEKLNYVQKGLKESKKNTYFITKLGIEILESYK